MVYFYIIHLFLSSNIQLKERFYFDELVEFFTMSLNGIISIQSNTESR